MYHDIAGGCQQLAPFWSHRPSKTIVVVSNKLQQSSSMIINDRLKKTIYVHLKRLDLDLIKNKIFWKYVRKLVSILLVAYESA